MSCWLAFHTNLLSHNHKQFRTNFCLHLTQNRWSHLNDALVADMLDAQNYPTTCECYFVMWPWWCGIHRKLFDAIWFSVWFCVEGRTTKHSLNEGHQELTVVLFWIRICMTRDCVRPKFEPSHVLCSTVPRPDTNDIMPHASGSRLCHDWRNLALQLWLPRW